jgi:DNA replication protein DnaC
VNELGLACKELKLGDLEQIAESVEYRDREQYLRDILLKAVEQRRTRRIERLMKRAGFPIPATLEGYDFTPITFPGSMGKEELLSLGFLERKENVLMLGSTGTGKTHLSIVLGMRACSRGKNVLFYRVADLTSQLEKKHKSGESRDLIDKIAHAEMLILDEMGYVPFSKTASELLFSVISKCYTRQSLIVTSNLEFGRWNEIFGDHRLTSALVDRLVHHSHILVFSGKSYRLREAMSRQESTFSEPTSD